MKHLRIVFLAVTLIVIGLLCTPYFHVPEVAGATTDTFYSNNSGEIEYYKATYPPYTTGTGVKSFANSTMRCGQFYDEVYYSTWRAYYSFSTAPLPDTATVTSVILSMAIGQDDSTVDFNVSVYSGVDQFSSSATLDWTDCATSEGIWRSTAGISIGTAYNMTILTTSVTLTGNTQFRLVTGQEGSHPHVDEDEYVTFSNPEETDKIRLYVTYTLPNNAPTIGAVSGTNWDDTDNCYAQKKSYTCSITYTDTDGYADIHYVELLLKTGGGTTRAEFQYHEDDNTVSTPTGGTLWTLDSVAGDFSRSGNNIAASWKFSAQWDATEESDLDFSFYVIDSASASASSSSDQNFDVVTRLVTTGLTSDDSRINVGGTSTISGTVYYGNDPGSNTASSSYPPNAEFTSVIIHTSAHGTLATDSTIVNGAFSASGAISSTVQSNTYHVYINLVDADGTDQDAVDGDTTAVIGDRYKVNTGTLAFQDADGRVNVGAAGIFSCTAQSEYDGHVLGSGDSLVLSSYTFTYNGTFWVNSTSQAAVTSLTINALTSVNEATYGITAGNINSNSAVGIWDRIEIYEKDDPIIQGSSLGILSNDNHPSEVWLGFWNASPVILMGFAFVLTKIPKRKVKTRMAMKVMFGLGIVCFLCFCLQSIPNVKATGITRVQGNARGTSTSSSISVTMVSTPTSGNILIATIGTAHYPTYSTVSSITQTGVTWTLQISKTYGPSSFLYSAIWFGVVSAGASTSITVTLSASVYYGAVCDVCEYSGVATTSFLDKTATSTASGTAMVTGTTATTTQADELWIGSISAEGYSQTTPTNGFTLLDGAALGYAPSEAYLEKIVSSTGTASSGTTLGGSGYGAGCIATFKAAADTISPTYSDIAHNTTIASNPCLFSCKWTDNIGLSGHIFSTNNTGSWANDTWTTLTGNPAWANVSKTLNSTVSLVVGYMWYCNDTANNWNSTSIQSLTTTYSQVPQYGSTGNNNTIGNKITLFYSYWTDDQTLSGYIFGTNNTGSWVNETWITFSAGWANVTKTLNINYNYVIQYQWWANDSQNQWNNTGTLSLTVTNPAVPTYSDVASSNSNASQSSIFSCYWSDDVELSGYIFSTNNTGPWTNETWTSLSTNPAWANVTKTLNSTIHIYVGYRWYCNDSGNNWNDTGIWAIYLLGSKTTNVTTNTYVIIWFKARYEYDSASYTSASGSTLSINGTLATYDSVAGYWWLNVTQAVAGDYIYLVSAISDGVYGLTVINDSIGGVTITWYLPNQAPTNDSLILDLAGATYKDAKTLLAQKEDYVFTYKCSDLNGVTDINYSEIRLDYSSKNVILRATRGSGDAWTFSEQSDSANEVTLNVAGSTHTTSGTQKTFNFFITINWAWGDSTETIGVQAYVIDVSSVSDQDDYLNIFGVEAHLATSTLAVNDYHCDVGATLTMTGYWLYDGTSVTPPNGDYQVKIKLAAVQKGSTDTTLVSGAFSINDVSASTIVGQYNYTVEASYMASAGNFSPVIVDKVNINSFSVLDDRINIGETASFTVSGIYWYDSAAWTGTYALNDTTSKSSAGRYNFTVQSITDATYGLTAFNMSVSDLYVIWDALDVSNIQAPIYLGNGIYQYDVEIRYASDNSSIDGASVNVTSIGETVSNSSGWASIILSQTNLTASGTYTVFGVNDNNYGITIANANETFDVSKWILSTSDIEGNVLSNATINVNSGSTSVWTGQYAIIDLYVPAASYSVNVTWLQSLTLNTTGSVSVLSDTSTVLNCTAYPYSFGGSRYDVASNATVSSKTFSSSVLTLTFSSLPGSSYILVSNCPSAPNYITNSTYDLASDFSLGYLILTHYSNATLSLGCEGWGNLYVYSTDKIIKTVTLVGQRWTATTSGLTGEIGTLEVYCGSKGSPSTTDGFTTTSYASNILTGTYSFSSDAILWLDWTTGSGPVGPGGDSGSYTPSALLATVFLSFPDSALKSTVLDGWLNISWTGMPKIYVWSVTCDSPFESWRVQVVSGLPFELKMNFTSGYESIAVKLEIPVDAETGALSIPCSVTLATPQGTTKTIRAIVYLTVVSSAQNIPSDLTFVFLGIFGVFIGLTVFRKRRKNQVT